MDGLGLWLEQLDQARRFQGSGLEAWGFGPREHPFRVVHSAPGARLRCYSTDHAQGPALFIVPAPIKRPYIWDMAPGRSVVGAALARGFAVYLIEWTEAQTEVERLGLSYFAGDLLAQCTDTIARLSRDASIFIAGHSLGGTFAALHAAYQPQAIDGLVLLEAPLHFAEASGDLQKLLQLSLQLKVAPSALLPHARQIPGCLLSLLAASASPQTFIIDRHRDYLESLPSPEEFAMHWRGVRWTLDESPMPHALFDDVVEKLYRQDQFMRDELTFGDTVLRPRDMRTPLFAVYDPESSVVPPASILEFYRTVSSDQRRLLPYCGDRGITLRHLGVLTGATAHREIWPSVFDWIEELV